MSHVTNDEEARFIRSKFRDHDEIPEHRILFHETAEGRVAFVREVRALLHIDGIHGICLSIPSIISPYQEKEVTVPSWRSTFVLSWLLGQLVH